MPFILSTIKVSGNGEPYVILLFSRSNSYKLESATNGTSDFRLFVWQISSVKFGSKEKSASSKLRFETFKKVSFGQDNTLRQFVKLPYAPYRFKMVRDPDRLSSFISYEALTLSPLKFKALNFYFSTPGCPRSTALKLGSNLKVSFS